MLRFSLPGLASESGLATKCRARVLALNCKGTKFAAIDTSGCSASSTCPKSEHAIARAGIKGDSCSSAKTRDVRWSDDDENAFAAMEKTKMVVYRGAEPEEPVVSSAHICVFRDLTVRAVALDEIMRASRDVRDGETAGARREHVVDHDTTALRDTRRLLAEAADAAEAFRFAEARSHPRLWRLLAEHALERHDLPLADKAFVRCSDYHGIQFVKRLALLESEAARRAEVAAYFARFDDAERAFLEADRADLAVDLRKRLGDWFGVEKLVASVPNAGDDDTLHAAWRHIEDYFADRRKWAKAVGYYRKTRDRSVAVPRLAECYYALEDFESLEALIEEVPETPEGTDHAGSRALLLDMAQKFVGVGLCAPAVRAYARARRRQSRRGRVRGAEPLGSGGGARRAARPPADPGPALQVRPAHLTETRRHADAVDLFQRAGKHLESANALRGLAAEAARVKSRVARAKKLHVLAALELDAHRRLRRRVARGTTRRA